MSDIIEQLRKIRKFEEISRAELAKKSGVNQYSIASYENGRMNPTIGLVEKILKALGYKAEIKKRGEK